MHLGNAKDQLSLVSSKFLHSLHPLNVHLSLKNQLKFSFNKKFFNENLKQNFKNCNSISQVFFI